MTSAKSEDGDAELATDPQVDDVEPEDPAQNGCHQWVDAAEAGKRRLAGDTARAATTGEVQDLRREARALKECVADLTLENRLLKKSMIADGGDEE